MRAEEGTTAQLDHVPRGPGPLSGRWQREGTELHGVRPTRGMGARGFMPLCWLKRPVPMVSVRPVYA